MPFQIQKLAAQPRGDVVGTTKPTALDDPLGRERSRTWSREINRRCKWGTPRGALQHRFHLKPVEDFTSDCDLLSLPRDKPQRCEGRFCGEARMNAQQGQTLRSG